MGAVPIVTAFAQSSNVAAAKLAVTRLAPAVFYRHLVDFGFGEKTGIDLPGEAPGLLRHVKDWTAQSVASLAYGYEIQVTGIQMAAAVAAIANKGFYMKPHVAREVRNFRGEVVKKIEPETLRRVCSQETSKRMLELMEAVVKEGTGKAAAIPGYRVGGKTGTTIKLDPETKRYSRGNYISSFCGVAPLDDPEICIYIWIDNPRGGVYYGGQVAAPVFKEIATCALKVLRIPPSGEAPAETPNPVEVASARPEEPWFPIVPRAEEDGDRAPGTMPDLRGLTMREVHERLVQLNLPFDIKGSGVVIDQVPRPFETIDPRERVLVICGTAEEYRKRLAGEAQQPAQPTNNVTMEAPNGGANQPVLKLRRGREEYEIPISSSQAATSNGSETRIKLPTPQSTPEPAEPTSVVEGEDPDARVRQGPLYDAGRSVWKKVIDNKLTQDAPPTRPAESTSDEGRNEAKKGSSRSPASAYEIGYSAKDQSDVSSSDSER
jgi:membrane peptidoglycan carboxypeptidase